MPSSVAEELETLRKRSLAKGLSNKLKNANGLSTPEMEEQTIKNSNSKTRSANYAKDAVKTLNAGSKAVDQDLNFKVQQGNLKKKDLIKRKEATQSNNAGVKAVDKHIDFAARQTAMKKEDQDKKVEATKNLQGYQAASPAAATPRVVDSSTSLPVAPKLTAKTSVGGPSVVQSTSSNQPDSSTDIEDVPVLEETNPADQDEIPNVAQVSENVVKSGPRIRNRAEKKAFKMMDRLGMKIVPGVTRVTLKMRGGQGFFSIQQPDVYLKNGAYIVFGEARQGAGIPQAQQQVQQQQDRAVEQLSKRLVDEKTAFEVEEIDAVDESGVEPKDIDLVVSQAGCSRAKAVAALKDNDGDLVNAIMALTA